MRHTPYTIGQQLILRGPLDCLTETLGNKTAWNFIFQRYAGQVVTVKAVISTYETSGVLGVPLYQVDIESDIRNTFYVHYHWLAPIEDDIFGFLYRKE